MIALIFQVMGALFIGFFMMMSIIWLINIIGE